MALANKERQQHISPNTSTMAIIHASAFYEPNNVNNDHEQRSKKHAYNIQEQPPHHDQTPSKNFTMSNSSSVSSPSSTSSNGLVYQTTPPCNNLSEESRNNSVITFTPQSGGFDGSFLNFEQNNGKRNVVRNLFPTAGMMGEEEGTFQMWEESIMQPAIHSGGFNHSTTHLQETSSSSHVMQLSWLNEIQMGENGDGLDREMGTVQEGNYNCNNVKRPSSVGESSQAAKKQCVGASKKGKAKTVSPSPSPSKDPQSVAAKNRRERISERLKILQDLVPNGSKVDLVTMLEKAISYVKFLQLQVKVLATDEFWPAPNGKAPDLSQVKEAIDAILASQRDRNSNSTSTK